MVQIVFKSEQQAFEPEPVQEYPYSYNDKGLLVYKKFTFSRASILGLENIINWRCTEYRKIKCKAKLKTKGKELIVLNAEHNHAAIKVPKTYKPSIYYPNQI